METGDDVIPMSNAFKLMCEDVCPKFNSKLTQKLYQTAKKIKTVLENSKDGQKISYKNLDYWTEFGVKHPLHHLQKAVEATASSVPQFMWKTPKNIRIHENSSTSKSVEKVQIFVEIPAEILGNRDFLNLTFAAKRGHFACHVATLLAEKFGEVQFTLGGMSRDDPIFPDLTVSEVENATPKFNQRMLWSILEVDLIEELEKEIKDHQTARLALHLFKSFLKNRYLHNAFPEVILTARVARLIKSEKIHENQEVLTILKTIFKDFMSWSSDEIEYVDPLEEKLKDDVAEKYSQLFHVNLIWRHLNLAANLTKNQMERMRKELASCYPLLGQVYTFDPIFIETLPIFAQYDHVARFHISSAQLSPLLTELGCDSVDNRDVITNFMLSFENKIEKTMSERYEFMGIHDISESKSTWKTSEYPEQHREKTFLIGFRISPGWKNPLTVGPSAQTDEAKAFREFWKESSELRKFADTRICECVVWSDKPSDKVPRAVVQFVLTKIFGLSTTCFSWRALTSTSVSSENDQNHEIKSQDAVFKAYSDLSSLLRGLKGLPLLITNVHGISGYLRGTEPAYPSVFAAASSTNTTPFGEYHNIPEIGKIPLYTPTVSVHIKLEYSGRWGNEVEAVRRLTSSFYLKIAEKLRVEHKLCVVPTVDQLFVLMSGIVFKILIVNDRILSILEEDVQKLKDSAATRIESSIPGIRLAMWKKKFVSEPLLQRSLQSFSSSHKFFGSTVQLFKKWLGAKLLSGHLNDHIIELLVVAAISGKGWSEPQSTWSSFSRLLALISTHPWSARPLIVEFGTTSFSEEDRSKLEEKFIKMRPILPPMVVIHEEDHLGSKFTRENPQGVVLNRLVAVAKETLSIIEKQAIGKNLIDLMGSLLSENLSIYHAIIHLEPAAVVRKKPILERKPLTTNTKIRQKIPVVELDPVDELIYQLNNSLHQVAIFFYNKYGGHHIGVLFKPQEEEVPAKISRCSLHKFVTDSALRLNRDEILENIQIIGQGIVTDIVLKN